MNEDEKTNRLRWAGWALLGVLLALGGAIALYELFKGGSHQVQRKPPTVLKVVLPPPPPPPPPPPKVPPPPKPPEPQKETPPQAPPKPRNAPPKPAQHAVAKPPGNPLTAPLGAGPSNYGLGVGNGGGDVIGGGGGGGGGGGSGLYDEELTSATQAALQRDATTRFGHFTGLIRISIAADGRVVSVSVQSFEGDDGMQAAVKRVLASLHFSAPPDGGSYTQTIRVNGR